MEELYDQYWEPVGSDTYLADDGHRYFKGDYGPDRNDPDDIRNYYDDQGNHL
jgi:hypothetical protein